MTSSTISPSDAALARIEALLGPQGVVGDGPDLAPFLEDWRDRWRGETTLACLPSSTEEAAELVKLCAKERIAIVPQSGATGLVGGHLPMGGAIVLSTRRMARIRNVDSDGFTLTAEAGAILADVRAASRAADRLFPLSLASEGSARIGGLIGANAGGVHVLRYGNMRALTLGLEAVTADGRIFRGLSPLHKDNTGYDLKHLFIGSEGTLGVITAATLKLVPRPLENACAMVALARLEACLPLLGRLQRATGGAVAAFELIPDVGAQWAVRNGAVRDPLEGFGGWRVLVELHGGAGAGLAESLENSLASALEDGEATDAILARSEAQAHELWRMRDVLSEAQKPEGASLKHDVAVPVSRVVAFIKEAQEAARSVVPECRPVFFGHVGDGNVHANVTRPEGMNNDAFLAYRDAMAEAVHGVALAMGGTISAEHGIGRAKRDLLARVKDPTAYAMMRAVKAALDPHGIMNPGVLL